MPLESIRQAKADAPSLPEITPAVLRALEEAYIDWRADHVHSFSLGGSGDIASVCADPRTRTAKSRRPFIIDYAAASTAA
jgi:hypothetical protein